MTLITVRRILMGLTLGVLLALLIAPQTRWLVQAQTRSLFHVPPVPSLSPQTDSATRAEAVAARHPSDYALQYTAIVWNDSLPLADKLRTLEARFPDNVSLRANILRYACDDIHWNRREDYLMFGQPVPSPNKLGPATDPTVLAAYDRDAAAGERMDPDNAYFPYMHAIGLYAAHKDGEAQAAILRAGRETRWDGYAQDEVTARWRLSALVFGPSANEALARTAVSASLLFMQYAKIRAVARAVSYQAVEAEQAGDFAHGIALRHALIHCAGLMRAQSPEIIDALVGIAIVQAAMSRPGGGPRVAMSDLTGAQAWSARVAAYNAYLRRHGDAVGAAKAVAEVQADQQALTIIQQGNQRLSIVPPLDQLLPWWLAELVLLTNAAWLLVLGGAAASLGRVRAIREARPSPAGITWGIAAGTLAAFGFLLFWVLSRGTGWADLPEATTDGLLALTLAAVVLCLWLVLRGPNRRQSLARGLGIGTLTGLAWWGLYALIQWQTTGMQQFLADLQSLLSDNNYGDTQSGPTLGHLLAPLFALAVPLLVLFVGLVRSRRAPLRVTVAAAAAPLACLLLLAYAGVILGTARQERIANDVLTQSFHNEGSYYATQLGQTWPGVVD